jgi:hypothetical protein
MAPKMNQHGSSADETLARSHAAHPAHWRMASMPLRPGQVGVQDHGTADDTVAAGRVLAEAGADR